MTRVSLILILLVAIGVMQNNPTNFVLNPSSPFVYMKFDHVGPRKSLFEGEVSEGLWLRIVNNCRIPIEVNAFGNPRGDPGAVIEDEVIRSSPGMTIEAGNALENPGQKPKVQPDKPPVGYSWLSVSRTVIAPGDELLISVPRNHVSDEWFMRVKFILVIPSSSITAGPFTELDFSNRQIPVSRPNQEVPIR
jgi:hypothetical protein